MSQPRYHPGTGIDGSSRTEPESTTSAFSTTSYDSYSEEDTRRDRTYSHRPQRERIQSSDTKNATFSSRDVRSDYTSSQDDVTVISNPRDVTFRSRDGETSTDTERHGSYDFFVESRDQKPEWSCSEASNNQKLSFLFLIISFLGHSLAVCTPYWVVGWEGRQMTLYEGVWLSCYRERGEGSWVCSNFDNLRGLFEQPVWYEAAQVSSVLCVAFHITALLVSSLYSFVVALRGRSRASWLVIIFTGSAAFSSFLSIFTFAGGYPYDQTFPPGRVTFHASFVLQILSFLVSLLSLGFHVRDSYPNLRIWDNKLLSNRQPSHSLNTNQRNLSPVKSKTNDGSKLRPFSLPRFPISRFRSSREKPSAPPMEKIEESFDSGEVSAGTVEAGAVPSPVTTQERSRNVGNNDSMSGYDSQV